MNDTSLAIISFVYVFAVIGVSAIVKKINNNEEISRKIIHIFVGNWILISPFFENIFVAAGIPFSFIIINFLSVQYNLIPSMEREGDEKSYGTVYYAISLFMLTLIAHYTGMWTISIVGVLIMAYGDGLAAIIGEKYGRKYLKIEKSKTVQGSLVVLIAAVLITFIVATINNPTFSLKIIFINLLISALNGIFAMYIEISGKNGFDNISLPIGSGIFAGLLIHHFSWVQVAVIVFSALILYLAYQKESISLNGAIAAILVAQSLFVFSGINVYISLILFFILGTIVSKINNYNKKDYKTKMMKFHARDWKQVFANSLPAVILAWISYFDPDPKYTLLSIAVFAAANADTFSSELGKLSEFRVFNILNGKTLPKGLSGGVSIPGLFAGFLGSALISLLAISQFGFKGFLISFTLGCLGTIIDSILGLLFQKKYLGTDGELQDFPMIEEDKPVKGLSFVDNNLINLITITIVPILGLLFINI